jgi:radical SAM superfamily enzyme YgiQ (UPF0313 family)
MYDAILISTHYSYGNDGTMIPLQNAGNHQDLSMVIPLGVIYIAQYLHDCGFNVRVVHLPHEIHALRRFGLNEDHLKNAIEKILGKYPARVCGIQVHWYLYCGGALFISNLYKKIFPESRIFLGGFMAAAYWREFLEASAAIDGVIQGEGEKIFRRIIEKNLKSIDDSLHDVKGVALRDSKDELILAPAGEDGNLALDELPIIHPDAPPFANISWPKRHFISISRGICPENCSYCLGNNKQINSRTYQTLQIERIIEQIRVYQQYGFRELFLGENHFINMPFMMALIENIIREKFNLYFELETHPVIFENKNLLDKMIEAKFLRFTMGCESGSGSVLKRIGRKSNSTQILDSVKAITERGGLVLSSWISNLPGETESEFQETQDVMRKVVQEGGNIYWIENLHVFPGTRLAENPKKWEIKILLADLDDWIRWALLSKRYVDFEEASKSPLKYLTHLNNHISPENMITRFYSNRKLALSLIPKMKSNLENRSGDLPLEICEAEIQYLDWYARKGWKLWFF